MESDSTGVEQKNSLHLLCFSKHKKEIFSIFKLRKFDDGKACEKKKPKTRLNGLLEASSGEST